MAGTILQVQYHWIKCFQPKADNEDICDLQLQYMIQIY